jgi:hypothetical protein
MWMMPMVGHCVFQSVEFQLDKTGHWVKTKDSAQYRIGRYQWQYRH